MCIFLAPKNKEPASSFDSGSFREILVENHLNPTP